MSTPQEIMNVLAAFGYAHDFIDAHGYPGFYGLHPDDKQKCEAVVGYNRHPSVAGVTITFKVHNIVTKSKITYSSDNFGQIVDCLQSMDRLPDFPTKGVYE